jgi:hypothetical protein
MTLMGIRWLRIGGVASLAVALFPAIGEAQVQSVDPDATRVPAAQESPVQSDTPAKQANAGGDGGLPGRPLLQIRPRIIYIDQSNKSKRAEAANMRLLLGYRTAPIGDFAFTGQLVNVSWHNPIHANDVPGNSNSPYPTVGDPDKTDVNLLFADYTGLPDTRVRLGRQAIKLDNERFVGDADVRQMPQVFDAISVRNTTLPNTELYAAQAWHLRTYFGNRFQTGTTLLNARVQFDFGASVGAYTYLMDQPQINVFTGLSDNSNRISGARLEGNCEAPAGLRWYYTAEAAVQRPYADGNPLIRADYHRLAFGPSWGSFSAQINHERLGSNQGQYGFQMPLSYNTFQGWAYQFFSTPPQGIRDLNASLASTFGRLNLWLKYHQFKPDYGGGKYGDEWDFAFDFRINDSTSIRGVFGRFRKDPSFVRPDADRYYLTFKYDY